MDKTTRQAARSRSKATAGLPQESASAKAMPSSEETGSVKKKQKNPAVRSSERKESSVIEVTYGKTAEDAAASQTAPRLLRRTKSAVSALALLEKGIEHIFRKDFHKARVELKSLLENYPEELDILARARSYMHICDREEAGQKKIAATSEQLYALGVLEHNKANYDKALSYFQQLLEKRPDTDYVYYSIAAAHARQGNPAESVRNLRRAVELNDDSRIHAQKDPDFAAMGDYREFTALVGNVSSTRCH